MGCPEGLAKSVCAGTQKRKHYFGCNGRGSSFSHEVVKLIPPRTPHPLTPNHLYQFRTRSCPGPVINFFAQQAGGGALRARFCKSVSVCFRRLCRTLACAPHTAPTRPLAVSIDRPRPLHQTTSDFWSCLNSGSISHTALPPHQNHHLTDKLPLN